MAEAITPDNETIKRIEAFGWCFRCGGTFKRDQLKQIEIDLQGKWICKDCAKRVLLIAGQVKVPGWIVLVEQPRNLSQLALQRGYNLSQDEVAELCEMGRDDCLTYLQGAFDEFWRDLGLDRWLKDLEIIESGEVKKSP